jgi:signal transduction histidine kinase
MAIGRSGSGWSLPLNGAAWLLSEAIYLTLLVTLALWLATRGPLTHGWQVVVLLAAAGLLVPLRATAQRVVGRWFARADAPGPAERLDQWLRDSSTLPPDPVAQLPSALCDALGLNTAAVAMPDGDGWRVAYAHGVDPWLGCWFADPAPGRDRFTDRPVSFGAVVGGVQLRLADRPAALVLLGDRLTGELLRETDLQLAALFLASVAGQVGQAQSQRERQRAETELQRLYDHVAALQQSLSRRQFVAVADHELRSALTVILGHAELLIDGVYGPIDDRQRGHIAAIHRQAEALTDVMHKPVLAAVTGGAGPTAADGPGS